MKETVAGVDWVKREIYKQELIVLNLKKDQGIVESRSVEQWLKDSIERLDKLLK